MAPVDEARKLDARGSSVLEDRLDGGTDRPPGRKHVVDEHARHALQREVEPRRADDGLRVARSLAVSDHHIVAVKGDVDSSQRDFDPTEVGDVAAEALRERDAARMDTDERSALEVTVPFDDLVSDPGERPVQGLGIQEDLARFDLRSHQRLLSGLTGPA
jgi:hypothetical protein